MGRVSIIAAVSSFPPRQYPDCVERTVRHKIQEKITPQSAPADPEPQQAMRLNLIDIYQKIRLGEVRSLVCR